MPLYSNLLKGFSWILSSTEFVKKIWVNKDHSTNCIKNSKNDNQVCIIHYPSWVCEEGKRILKLNIYHQKCIFFVMDNWVAGFGCLKQQCFWRHIIYFSLQYFELFLGLLHPFTALISLFFSTRILSLRTFILYIALEMWCLHTCTRCPGARATENPARAKQNCCTGEARYKTFLPVQLPSFYLISKLSYGPLNFSISLP